MADRERLGSVGSEPLARARRDVDTEAEAGESRRRGHEVQVAARFPTDWTDAPCAICGSRRGGAPLHLTHAVTVWLCPTHRDGNYLRRDRGTLFTRRLAEIWAVTGTLSARRISALRSHLRRVATPPGARRRPGSYSWPALRREAESRFAAGEPPGMVIDELRHRHRHDPADVPTVRTMRRWFAEGRWLRPPEDRPSPRPWRPSGRTPRSRILEFIDDLPRGMALAAFFPWYLPPATSRSP